MEALAASGNRAEALVAYEALRIRLREDLGVAPGAALQDLHAQLLARPLRARSPNPARPVAYGAA